MSGKNRIWGRSDIARTSEEQQYEVVHFAMKYDLSVFKQPNPGWALGDCARKKIRSEDHVLAVAVTAAAFSRIARRRARGPGTYCRDPLRP